MMKKIFLAHIFFVAFAALTQAQTSSLSINSVCENDNLYIQIVDFDLAEAPYTLTGPNAYFKQLTIAYDTIFNVTTNYTGTFYMISALGTTSLVNVTIYPKPRVRITAPPVCSGGIASYSAFDSIPEGNLTSYRWTFLYNTSTDNPYTFVPDYSSSGNLVATSIHECVSIYYCNLEIQDYVFFTLSSFHLCSGQPLSVVPDSGGSYLWLNTNETTPVIYPNVTQPTLERVIYTPPAGCQFLLSAQVFPTPQVSFVMINNSSSDIVENNSRLYLSNGYQDLSFLNKSNEQLSFFWDYGDLASINNYSTSYDGRHKYVQSGNYTIKLTGTSSDNCSSDYLQTIRLENQYLINIPNAFSPNDDGINDWFCISGTGFSKKSFSMSIYDRHNKLLFHTNISDDCWNGIAPNGKPYPNGVYLLNIQLMNLEDEIIEFNRTITITR